MKVLGSKISSTAPGRPQAESFHSRSYVFGFISRHRWFLRPAHFSGLASPCSSPISYASPILLLPGGLCSQRLTWNLRILVTLVMRSIHSSQRGIQGPEKSCDLSEVILGSKNQSPGLLQILNPELIILALQDVVSIPQPWNRLPLGYGGCLG